MPLGGTVGARVRARPRGLRGGRAVGPAPVQRWPPGMTDAGSPTSGAASPYRPEPAVVTRQHRHGPTGHQALRGADRPGPGRSGLLDLDAPAPLVAGAPDGRLGPAGAVAPGRARRACRPRPHVALLRLGRPCARLAGEEPLWESGTAIGESALFYGHLVGEVVRRADGRAPGAFLREEVCGPAGLDFAIGLDDRRLPRAVDLTGLDAPEWARDAPDPDRSAGPCSTRRALDGAVVNSAAFRRAEVPAINGHGTARAIAGLYAALLEGRLLSPALRDEAASAQASGVDRVMGGEERAGGLGFAVEPDGLGMGGVGGSVGVGRTVGVTRSPSSPRLDGRPRAQRHGRERPAWGARPPAALTPRAAPPQPRSAAAPAGPLGVHRGGRPARAGPSPTRSTLRAAGRRRGGARLRGVRRRCCLLVDHRCRPGDLGRLGRPSDELGGELDALLEHVDEPVVRVVDHASATPSTDSATRCGAVRRRNALAVSGRSARNLPRPASDAGTSSRAAREAAVRLSRRAAVELGQDALNARMPRARTFWRVCEAIGRGGAGHCSASVASIRGSSPVSPMTDGIIGASRARTESGTVSLTGRARPASRGCVHFGGRSTARPRGRTPSP